MLTVDEIIAEFRRVQDPESQTQDIAIRNLEQALKVVEAFGLMHKLEKAREEARNKNRPEGRKLTCTSEAVADLLRSILLGRRFYPRTPEKVLEQLEKDLEIKTGNMDPVTGTMELFVSSQALEESNVELMIEFKQFGDGAFMVYLKDRPEPQDPPF